MKIINFILKGLTPPEIEALAEIVLELDQALGRR